MTKYFVFLILTPLTAIYLHRWAIFFVRSIQYVSEKFNKRVRGLVFILVECIAVIAMQLPLFVSLIIIFGLFLEDTNNDWLATIVLILNWIISFIPAIIHIMRNKDTLIAAGYWQDTPQKTNVARIIIARMIIGVAGLVTGIAFMAACLFFIVFIFNDYPTAWGYIVEGGPIPGDVFNIGGFVAVISLIVGIPNGMTLWAIIFTKLGLSPRDEDA